MQREWGSPPDQRSWSQYGCWWFKEGVSVWDTAQAFSVLANEGIRTDLTTITKIVDSDGNVLYEHEPNKEEILSTQASWLTTSALIDTVRTGTATALRIGRTVAVKTGTRE